VLGAFGGFLAGLLGIGGGMILIPFLMIIMGASGVPAEYLVKIAIATSLTTILFTSASSMRAHHNTGAVRWDVVKVLAPGIVLGSLVGAQLAGWIDNRLLEGVFAAFLGYTGAQMLRKRRPPPSDAPVRTLPGSTGMFAMGGLIGIVSALVGAGGGFLTVPFLTSRQVRIRNAVATSAACGFPIALAGALGYIWAGRNLSLAPGALGYIYLPALVCLAAASMSTAPLGVRVAHRIDTDRLRKIFGLVLFAMAAYMFYKAFA
jgi:uncharacterized protein